jgi:hypothetical protein
VTRWLLAAAFLLMPGAARAQEFIYALPGGASADNIGTPNAFAACAGVCYIAVSVHTEPRARNQLDGLAVIGAGSGAISSAVEFSLALSDLSRLSGAFGSVKWHFHDETARGPALAVGIEDITSAASSSSTPYVSATKTFWNTSARSAFLMHTTLSAGFGGGRFYRRPFGAISTSLDSFSKAILEYDGRGLNAGVSVAQTLSPRTVAVVVVARQHVTAPSQRAWTMGVALAWN